MLNPMVQSDLVTYKGGTIVILFLQAANIKSSIFSNKSNDIISAVMEIVKPDRVMIESCEERRQLLSLEPTGKFSWDDFFTAPTPEMEKSHNDFILYVTLQHGFGSGILFILHAILENFVS